MLIKDSENPGHSSGWRRRSKLWTALVGLFCVLTLAVTFVGGAQFYRAGLAGWLVNDVLKNSSLPANFVRGLRTTPERITIDIRFRDFQKLAYQREAALTAGILIKDSESFVPAQIQFRDSSYKAVVRLKGDLPDHYAGDKWSLRVRLKGSSAVLGMKQFSLQTPETRQFIFEWLFHRMAQREDIIGLRYTFVDVVINGKDMGLFALEESFDKRLIESNKRREGPIVKFDETNFWREKAQFDTSQGWPGAGHYFSMPIDAFQSSSTVADSALRGMFLTALNRLEGFRKGKLRASEVFDAPRLARYLALCDLLGAFHALNVIQFRFYYSPVSGLLEPIAFDANAGRQTMELACAYEKTEIAPWREGVRAHFIAKLFEDPQFFETYVRAVTALSEKSYLDSALSDLKPGLDSALSLIYSDYPSYRYSADQLYANQQFVRRSITPIKLAQVHFRSLRGDTLTLEVANSQQLPVKILGVELVSQTANQPKITPLETIATLPARDLREPLSYSTAQFRLPKSLVWRAAYQDSLVVRSSVPGRDSIWSENVAPWPHFDSAFANGGLFALRPNAHEFPFVSVSDSSRAITLMSGHWKLDRTIVFPTGYTVVCANPFTLDLGAGVSIISYSPFRFHGDPDDPIVFRGVDSASQGLVVMARGERSELAGCVFEGLGALQHGPWALSGSVNFYESPVTISSSVFVRNHCEDALNIIRSQFVLEGVAFRSTQADALDLDFCHGVIRSCSFDSCGNDGIDASGSGLEILGVKVHGAGDKGISIGEGSDVFVQDIVITDAEIGMAGKDLSRVQGRNISIEKSRVGITVFQKKPEYGVASVNITGLRMSDVENPYLVETGATLIVDDAPIQSNQEKVRAILYGVKFGKSSN